MFDFFEIQEEIAKDVTNHIKAVLGITSAGVISEYDEENETCMD